MKVFLFSTAFVVHGKDDVPKLYYSSLESVNFIQAPCTEARRLFLHLWY